MEIERLPKGQKIEDVLPLGEIDACMLPEITPKRTRHISRSAPLVAKFSRSRKTILPAHQDFSDSPRCRCQKFDTEASSVGRWKPRRSFYQSQRGRHQTCERYAALLSRLVRRGAGGRERTLWRRRLALQYQ